MLSEQEGQGLQLTPPQSMADWDSRVYALSPGNADWLQKLGIWSRLPEERLTAEFTDDSVLELTPDLVGPSITGGLLGPGVGVGTSSRRSSSGPPTGSATTSLRGRRRG